MSREVPEGWEIRRIADVASVKGGKRMPAGRPFADGRTNYPYIRVSDFSNGSIDRAGIVYVLPEDQKLISRYTISSRDVYISIAGTIGVCGMIPPDLDGAQLTENAAKIAVHSEAQLIPEFLTLLMSSEVVQRQISAAKGVGGGVPKLALFRIEGMTIPVPPPHEQRRIAEILSSVDEAIAAMRAVIEQTRKVKQGVLERLLTKGIGHTRFKQTEIGEVPAGWEVAEVQEHFHVQLGKMLSKAAKVGSSPSPYLRNANVQWGRIDIEDVLHMDFAEHEKEKFRLQPGDLLVCEGGEVGRCAIWNDEREMYYQKALHRLREKTGVVKNEFLMYVLVRVFTSKALSAGLVGTNSIAHFTREQFLRLHIPVPDADEQNAICETLQALDVSIIENISQREALLTLKSALMSDLLTGRKRVTDALPMAAE